SAYYVGSAAALFHYISGSHVVVIRILHSFPTRRSSDLVFKLADLHLSLISFHFIMAQNILRMLSKKMWTFYASLPFYLINSVGMVGIRSYLTQIVEPNELGRIFSMMSAIDALLPLLSSLIFSSMFRITIDTIPNLSFAPVCLALM